MIADDVMSLQFDPRGQSMPQHPDPHAGAVWGGIYTDAPDVSVGMCHIVSVLSLFSGSLF